MTSATEPAHRARSCVHRSLYDSQSKPRSGSGHWRAWALERNDGHMSMTASPRKRLADRFQRLLYRAGGSLLIGLGFVEVVTAGLRTLNISASSEPMRSIVVAGMTLLVILAGGLINRRLCHRVQLSSRGRTVPILYSGPERTGSTVVHRRSPS